LNTGAVTGDPAAGATGCANCGAPFVPERRRFCPECGQETHVQPPRLVEFLQQFGGAYFSTEGALWRTLKLLLFKPGELTRQYLAGRRKHYVLPLRLYLTISLATLLVVRLAGSVEVNLQPEASKEIAKAGNNLVINLGGGQAGLREGVFFCDNLPAWVCKRFKRRIDIDPKAMSSEIGFIKERFLGNLGGAMFLLLPAFALSLKLAYLGRRMRYTEHLVFALHVHAFWFLALMVAMSGVDWLVLVLMLGVPVYTLLAMKRVYGGRLWPRLLRAALVSVLYGVVLTAAVVGVGLFTLLS
jgi:Protein of unknown function (DUF3667)